MHYLSNTGYVTGIHDATAPNRPYPDWLVAGFLGCVFGPEQLAAADLVHDDGRQGDPAGDRDRRQRGGASSCGAGSAGGGVACGDRAYRRRAVVAGGAVCSGAQALAHGVAALLPAVQGAQGAGAIAGPCDHPAADAAGRDRLVEHAADLHHVADARSAACSRTGQASASRLQRARAGLRPAAASCSTAQRAAEHRLQRVLDRPHHRLFQERAERVTPAAPENVLQLIEEAA